MVVEDLSECDVYFLDHIGSMLVDNVINSTIVTGPIESSLFLRGSTNSIFVIACQQLRLRDCKDCTILLYSQTRPIIENSTNISFGCYDYDYFGFEENLVASKLDIWRNRWTDVYDFTSGGKQNFTLLPLASSARSLLKHDILDRYAVDGLAPASLECNKCCGILRTCGIIHIPKGADIFNCFLAFQSKHEYVSLARQILDSACLSSNFRLIRTNKYKINSQQARILRKDKSIRDKDLLEDFVFLHLVGPPALIQNLIEDFGLKIGEAVITSTTNEKEVADITSLVFEKWLPSDQ
jgi:hypothetical protein